MKTFIFIFSVSILIAGNIIGAGILALPTNAGLAGFIPATIGMIVAVIVMFYSSIVLSQEAIDSRDPSFNFPSMYKKHIGKYGKWLAIAANLIILYGLLTAYLTGGTTIIGNVLNLSPVMKSVSMIVLFFGLTVFIYSGVSLIRKLNSLIMLFLFISFVVIVAIAQENVKIERLFEYSDWHFFPATFPILITAFNFHHIIPSISTTLKWNKKHIIQAIAMALLFAFLLNLVWLQVGIGSLPLMGENSLDEAFRAGYPATIPLSRQIPSQLFVVFSLLFALLAIITSYLATGISLKDFITDITENELKINNKIIKLMIAFGPPIIISLLYPDIFLKSMDIVGGIGIVTLFGILPCIIAIKKNRKSKRRYLGYAVLILFCLFLVIEIAQEMNLLKLVPECEHWTVDLF